MTSYIKKNGLSRVYVVGWHPMKDYVAITTGGDDIVWVQFKYFLQYYELES